jgi:acyl-CoA hydrolase
MAGLTRPGAQAPGRWQDRLVSPEVALSRLRPGMRIFIGTGVAEPRTLVRALMGSRAGNLEDLELIQLVSFGDAMSLSDPSVQRFRLKTFYPGYVVSDAISEGRVDWIPCDFAQIPGMFEAGQDGGSEFGPSPRQES